VHALDTGKQAECAKTLQRLCGLTWTQITLAGRHGQGSELIPARSIKPSIPLAFQRHR
jgi:hypothetical protein